MSTALVPSRPAPTRASLLVHACGLRQRQVAEALGVSEQHLSNVLSGHRRPSRLLANALAGLLHVDARDLFA